MKFEGLLAAELARVLAPGGAIVWYDMFRDNPRNKNVTGIGRSRIRELFPSLQVHTRSITLAPPLARFVVPRSKTIACHVIVAAVAEDTLAWNSR